MPNTTVYTNNQYYQDIAAAIRSKNGQSTLYKPSEMAPAINALVVSGESVRLQTKAVDPTAAQQNITADTGYHGLSSVTVNAVQTETRTITENGTYTPTANRFFSNIVVNVAGSDLPDGDLLAYGNASETAIVDTAIVGKDVVAPSENPEPAMQTIWEGTFVAESSGGQYRYETPNVQNGNLIKNCNEVSVTFDGATYVLPVEQGPMGYVVEATDFGFAFVVESPSSTVIASLMIIAPTEGEHTIKVEGTPSVNKVLIPETTFTKGSNDLYHFDGIQTFDDESIKITLNGTDYYASIDNENTELGNIDYWVEDENISIYLYSYATAVSIVPSGVTIEIQDENSGVEHDYTIKVETTDAPTDAPIEDIDWSALQPGKDN